MSRHAARLSPTAIGASSLVSLLLLAACADLPTAPSARSADGFTPRLATAADPALRTGTFCNATRITTLAEGPASVFPLPVSVSGMGVGRIKVTASIRGLTHSASGQVELLLGGPTGANTLLMSDVGGASDALGITLGFDDDAATGIPVLTATTPIPAGTYKPSVGAIADGSGIPNGGPLPPYGSALSVFALTDPNGTWNLYFWDDTPNVSGFISNGWCVTINVINFAPVAHAGGPYTVEMGDALAFDGTGSFDQDGDPMAWSWSFGDGATGTGPTPEHTYTAGGTYTVTLVVADDGGLTRSTTTTVTVLDPVPTATFTAPSDAAEGSTAAVSFTSPSMPDARYAFDCGGGTFGEIGSASSASCAALDDGPLTVRGRVIHPTRDDAFSEYSATIMVTNVAPVVTAIDLPSSPVSVGTPITISADFTDAGTLDTHQAMFDLDFGGATAVGTTLSSGGSGIATTTVTYAEPGVYTIGVTVKDDDGGMDSRSSELDAPAYIVVYDPSAGFVTGGGWITSPIGSYSADPSLTGRASFGFVSKFQKGAKVPTGNTEFHFKAGGLNFTSTTYEWLVVSGSRAQYKGEGTINGAGRYGFMVTAVDGNAKRGEPDRFRIRIWDFATGGVVYDNHMGAKEDSDASTALEGGSIVIHR